MLCKNSPTCQWKSCEVFHNTDQMKREYAETNAGKKVFKIEIK